MIERALDDGTIVEVDTDDPAVANAAMQAYLLNGGGAPPPPPVSPAARGGAIAPAAPIPDAAGADTATVTPATPPEDTAWLWRRAVMQSALSEPRRADLRRVFGPDARALSDEAIYDRLAELARERAGPGQALLIHAKRAMGERAWQAFTAAQLRSLGRDHPEADFDPARFTGEWRGLSDVFKAQLGPAHRSALEAIDLAARRAQDGSAPDPLATLQRATGGYLVGRWLASPGAAPAVARWAREVDLATRLPPERGARMHALANRTLAGTVASVSGDEPAAIRARLDASLPEEAIAAAEDPFERAAARRRGEIAPRPDSNIPKILTGRDAPAPPVSEGPSLRSYDPTWKDRIAASLMGDERASPYRRRLVSEVMGSTGLGSTGLGLIDATPVGAVLGAQEASKQGDYRGAALAILPGAPLAQLGRFATTTPTRILRETKEGGGYSVNLASGEKPKDGLLVGIHPKDDPRNLVVPTAELNHQHILQLAEGNKAEFAKPDRFLRVRSDPADGNTYLEVVRRFEPDEVRKAAKYGERKGQTSGHNAATGESFPIGNFEEFIKTPEFERRVVEMVREGREYLSKFGTKEWWDMYGTSLERVYGRERVRELAGLIAATSPNATPEKNLQMMSEYMRRLSKGEPLVQPDYRVPAGTMSRREGTQLGMERSRVANVEKAGRGDLEALQGPKVHDVAAALMGDPMAVMLDRIIARFSEKPSAGIFTNGREGIIRGKEYTMVKNRLTDIAEGLGITPRELIGNLWAGARETVRGTGELYGMKYLHHNVRGESKALSDVFDDLVRRKAAHLKISIDEMERRLRNGDAELLSIVLSTPAIAALLSGQLPATSSSSAETPAETPYY